MVFEEKDLDTFSLMPLPACLLRNSQEWLVVGEET
jgi:hypothetical protein